MKIDLTEEQLAQLNPYEFTFTSNAMPVLENCPAAGVFRGPKRTKVDPWLWYGIFVHRFLEKVTNSGVDAALKYIREKAANAGNAAKNAAKTCELIDVDSIPQGEAEVAYAHDLQYDRVRRIYGRHDRALKTEATGKADLVYFDGAAAVADYKTNLKEADADPNKSPQLLGLICAAVQEKRVEDGKISLVGVMKTGELDWYTISVPAPARRAFTERMQRVHLRVTQDREAFYQGGIVPEFHPGSHCHRCGAQPVCPAIPPPTTP